MSGFYNEMEIESAKLFHELMLKVGDNKTDLDGFMTEMPRLEIRCKRLDNKKKLDMEDLSKFFKFTDGYNMKLSYFVAKDLHRLP